MKIMMDQTEYESEREWHINEEKKSRKMAQA